MGQNGGRNGRKRAGYRDIVNKITENQLLISGLNSPKEQIIKSFACIAWDREVVFFIVLAMVGQ